MGKLTSGKDDYLKAIYLITEEHEVVSNKELSDMLQVSPPSVSEMISKLQKQGLIDYTAYKGSKITKKEKRSRKTSEISCTLGSISRRKARIQMERSSRTCRRT